MRNSFRYGAMLMTIVATLVFGVTLVRALTYSPETEAGDMRSLAMGTSADVESANRGAPIQRQDQTWPARLVIPSIDVDATVQHVGRAYSGNMMPPSNFTDVGWFREGSKPGSPGNAVFDGHVDNGLGLPAVFKHLADLEVGDSIAVEQMNGDTIHFKVIQREVFPYDEVPRDEIFASTGPPQLKLITCAGEWIQSERMYGRRIVVTAGLVD